MKCFFTFSKEKLIFIQPHLTHKTIVSKNIKKTNKQKKPKKKTRGVNINEVIEFYF